MEKSLDGLLSHKSMAIQWNTDEVYGWNMLMHFRAPQLVAFKLKKYSTVELQELQELDEGICIAKDWVQEGHKPGRKLNDASDVL